MKIAYRTDHRTTFEAGDVMEIDGDHLAVANFPDRSRRAELALRKSPEHTDLRINALYLYFDLQMAEEDWRHRGKVVRSLYKVSFEDDDLLHVGDLDTFDRVAKDIAAGNDSSTSVERYWAGSGPSRYSECLVRKATVLEVVRQAATWQSLYRTAVEKLRDEPRNADFYKNLIPGRQV
jgi:hypothetical protein